jgi:hypothetical protein
MLQPVNAEAFPAEYLWLEGGQEYVVCAFYTPEYFPHLLGLKRSLEELGVNHFFKRYERAASWEAATRIKPAFLQECLAKVAPRHILYIDADAAVRKVPSFLDDITTDIALSPKPRKKHGIWHVRVNSNTVYIRNTPGGQHFLQVWKEAEKHCGALEVDGDMLQIAFGKLPGLTMTLLPALGSKVGEAEGEPAFEQFHVSRGGFKWSRLLQRARKRALVAGGVLLIASIAYVLLAG